MKKLFLALLLCCFANPALATLTQDGFQTANNTSTSVGVATTTSNSNDVIIAIAICNNTVAGGNAACGVTSVSGCGLTWALRIANDDGAGSMLETVEEWYAIAASPLSACTITAAYSGGPSAARIIVWGINGANTTTPFDTNGSVPATSRATTATTLSETVTTNNPKTFLFAVLRINGSNAISGLSRPTSFATLGSAGTFSDQSFLVVSSLQSSFTETYSWTSASQASAVMIADAVQDVTSPSTQNAIWFGEEF